MAQINKPSEYFNTKLYTGNNNVTQCYYRSWFSTRFSLD
jgi:hypothetical protein